MLLAKTEDGLKGTGEAQSPGHGQSSHLESRKNAVDHIIGREK